MYWYILVHTFMLSYIAGCTPMYQVMAPTSLFTVVGRLKLNQLQKSLRDEQDDSNQVRQGVYSFPLKWTGILISDGWNLANCRMFESIFSAIFLHLVCACRTRVIFFFDCNTFAVCAVPSSRLAGESYSNLLSTYYQLPGCQFEGLLNRNLSGCPFLMT